MELRTRAEALVEFGESSTAADNSETDVEEDKEERVTEAERAEEAFEDPLPETDSKEPPPPPILESKEARMAALLNAKLRLKPQPRVRWTEDTRLQPFSHKEIFGDALLSIADLVALEGRRHNQNQEPHVPR